jgi:protein-glutamine gamma-glutamyltransferase
MGAYMLGCVWIFIATLIGFQRINTEATIKERLVPAGWLMLQAIPLMLVLFFLFPRLSGPLWSMPQDNAAISGLSDSMSPGDISKLSKSDAIAFGVDFESAVPQAQDLYWRGPVLGRQSGRGWTPYQVQERRELNVEKKSPGIKYRVTLQPHNKTWLFALDLPATLPVTTPEGGQDYATFLADFQMRAREPVTQIQSYEVTSYLAYRTLDVLSAKERNAYLNYNANLNPRTIEYGKKLASENPDPKALVDKLFTLYNTQFTYTLEPPLLGENPMDEFLFETKQGFCEHYAGSFVLLLRAAGIPARVVTGYQGGEVNPINRQLIVRQSDAHAWSEVWFEDLGWLRVDPTSFVSPLRINRGFSAAIGPVGVFNTMVEADKLGLLRQLRYSWDAANNQWNQWVVGFNSAKQRSLFENLGVRNVDWATLATWLIGGIFLASAPVGLFLLLRIYRTRKDPLVAAYEKLCAKLAKTGFARAPEEGPHDFLQRIESTNTRLGQTIRPLIETYVALRYCAPSDLDFGLGDHKMVAKYPGKLIGIFPIKFPIKNKKIVQRKNHDHSQKLLRQFAAQVRQLRF